METRRRNLRAWVERNGVPQKERSLFSQLKGDYSFGERLARRLEQTYGMGHLYLDTPGADVAQPQQDGRLAASMQLRIETAEELRLLTIYRLANEREREAINDVVESMGALIDERTRDQTKARR